MTQLSPSLRKAAVLITALDADAGEALLAMMTADDAQKIRSALVELSDITGDEQQEVLASFLNAQAKANRGESADEVTLDLDPAVEAAAATFTKTPAVTTASPPPEPPSFDFLTRVEPKAIASVMCREMPQTVAVVIAHLPPEHAAAVLEELPPALATEALERIAWLDELSADIQHDLIRELRQQLAPHIQTANADAASLAHLSAVLRAMNDTQRQQLVSQLGVRNQSLLDRLGLSKSAPRLTAGSEGVVSLRYRLASRVATNGAQWLLPRPGAKAKDAASVWITFDDFVKFDDAALRAIFAAADADVSLVALTGAEPRLLSRILRKLQPAEAATLRHRLEHPGPIRLRDVEQARFALAAVASRLAHEGSIDLPQSVRFAAAI
jgi:flagellar motor switch protein FliG